jgi:hypothetical protein
MKSKHKFVPSQVVPMEERALLSTFPAGVGPVTTLGLSGNRVLTATTYNAVSHAVTNDILAFRNSVINTFNLDNVNGVPTAAFFTTVGIGSLGGTTSPNALSYGSGTLLARLDAQLGALEFHLPWGGGLGINNPTGGSGLSNKTAFTTKNPQSLGLHTFFNRLGITPTLAGGVSVAEDMELTLENFDVGTPAAPFATTAAALFGDMNAVLTQAVSTSPTGSPVFTSDMTLGMLPGYVQAGGPGGARLFGLKNK